MHLLDLIAWFHAHVIGLENAQSLNPLFLERIDDQLQGELRSAWCKGVFSKGECKVFLDLLNHIGNCESADFIFAITSTTTERFRILYRKLHEMLDAMTFVDNNEQKEKNRFPERVIALRSKALLLNLPLSGLSAFGPNKSTLVGSPVFQRNGLI